MAEFKAVTLYKEGNEYLCETEERLERFLAAGWTKTKPKGKKAEATEKAERVSEEKKEEPAEPEKGEAEPKAEKE